MALVAGALLASGAAQAQYASPPPPYVPYAEVPRDDAVFTGLRVEARLSYDHIEADLVGFDRNVSDVLNTGKRDGLGYGGEVGFDLPLGGIVLGAYAGLDGSTIRQCATALTETLCLRPGRSVTAGGRIGVPINRSVLLYAKGGYTNGQIRYDYNDTSVGGSAESVRMNMDGYHVGAGVEAALTRNTYGRLEYVYTKLRGARDEDDGSHLDFNRQQVQAGFGLRF